MTGGAIRTCARRWDRQKPVAQHHTFACVPHLKVITHIDGGKVYALDAKKQHFKRAQHGSTVANSIRLSNASVRRCFWLMARMVTVGAFEPINYFKRR